MMARYAAPLRWSRVLRRMLAINLTVTLQYRGDFFVMQLRNLVTPMVSLLVWQAVAASGARLPVSPDYVITYFVLVSVVNMLTASWTAYYLAESIRLGELARWLVRPTSTHWEGVANNIGEKAVKLVLILPMITLLAVVLRHHMVVPTAPSRWLLFGVSLLLAATMVFTMDVIVGATAFWFEDVTGFDRARTLVVQVLSGAAFPLALVPGWAAGVVDVQPFRYAVSFPLEVLLDDGAARTQTLVTGFAWQVGWTAAFVLAATIVWRLGLRAYSASGA